MDPEEDCPICFESYGTECERHTVPCCGQVLCHTCGEALRRCPFCRFLWDGEEADDGTHPWLRNIPNPALFVMGAMAYGDSALLRGAVGIGSRAAAALGTAAAAAGEASPVVIAGSAAGAAALAGAAAVYVASQHCEAQAERLQSTIRERARRCPVGSWSEAVGQLCGTLQWYLSPQKEGLPHVYHGSVWRRESQSEHLLSVQALCTASPPDHVPSTSETLWADLIFCYTLWLEYSPHTANWGTCPSYAMPPLHFCWHNRWREDLRHAVSDLARRVLAASELCHLTNKKEHACVLCLLGMLDHLLSWNVTTPEHGSSDLIDADWYAYRSFCRNLNERFATAWAAALAPPEAELNLVGFDAHVVVMAERDIPEAFRNLW